VASLHAQIKCLKELLTNLGDDVNAVCEQGNYPIHYACMGGSLPCAITLLHFGADLGVVNPNGQTPLDLIPESKQASLGNALRRAEKKRNELKENMTSIERQIDNFPTPDRSEIAVRSIYPVPFINNKLTVNSKELETGQHSLARFSFYKGTFDTSKICVKSDTGMHKASSILLIEEATLLGEIRHPNILLLLGMTSPPDFPYQLVFEEIHLFLYRLIFVEKLEFNSEQLLQVGRDISSALTYLHHRGFIHCSLNCSSVVLTNYLTVKLCNFENAQKMSKAKPISHFDWMHSHMAPDQLKGMKADTLNDVYALGGIVFECATNRQIQTLGMLNENSKEKEILSLMLKFLPKSLEGSISTLISSCIVKAKKRASALQIYQWTDALLGSGGLAETNPLEMNPDADCLKLDDPATGVLW